MSDEFEVQVNVGVKDKLVIDALRFMGRHSDNETELFVHAVLCGMVCAELTGLNNGSDIQDELEEPCRRIVSELIGGQDE